MIYFVIGLTVVWLVICGYFLKHIRLIIDELNEINKEQCRQNMDIIHLMKMDVEITRTLDHNAKILNQTSAVTEYLLELNDKEIVKKSPSSIFSPPKGEA
jgi:hypothetical protein